MTNEFKIGDKVIIKSASQGYRFNYEVGEICEILNLHSPSGSSFYCRFKTKRRGDTDWYVKKNDVELIDSSSQMPSEPKLITMEGIYYKRMDMIDDQPKPGAKPVRVLCVDRENKKYPVIYIDICGNLHRTTKDGRNCDSYSDSPYDLIEYKPLRKMKKFISKYGKVVNPEGYDKNSYVFHNGVEFAFDGDRLVDVKLVND